MMEHNDIYRILENLDAAQKSVKQLPALFKPAQTSPQLSGPYPGKNATRGYMVGEGESLDDMNSMGRAVAYRIANQRPEWFMKYGLEAVMQTIADVTEGETDWEEIGSSDVSAYVNYVADYLRDHHGSREEMDEQGVAEGFLGDREYNRVMPFVKRIASEVSDYDRDEFGEELWSLLDQKYGSKFAQSVLQDSLDFYWDEYTELAGQQGVAEGQDNTIYQVSRAMLDNNPGKSYLHASEDDILGDAARELARMGMSDIKVGAIMRDPDFAGELIDTLRGPITESSATTEDVISTVKKKLGDYLSDLSKEIKKDPDLKDRVPQDIDQIKAVKTIKTDDGHEIKIHGNEDDGFRISIKNKDLKTAFKNLDEATMACEMYCARRRGQTANADYIEEKTS